MLKKLFKKLKVDFYYFRKLLKEERGKHFFSYCKNKYFGSFLINKFPRFEGKVDENFEVHILCQKSMLWPLIVCIRSFLFHSGLTPRVVVHVDDFNDKSSALLKSKFSNVTILKWDEATALINQRTDISDKIKKYRFGKNILIVKLIDGFLLSKARRVMILGSDVLFYSNPREIVEFIRGQTGCDGLASYDETDCPINIERDYLSRLRFYEQELNHFNSDLIVFDKTKIRLEWFVEFFEHIPDPDDYWLDLIGFAALFAQINWKFLPYERYRLKGGIDEQIVSKHFTGPRRHQLYAWGIDPALKRMFPFQK